jgi:serine/threonine protein kinase/formylglycine-generating enzyme required for sulfatase activity
MNSPRPDPIIPDHEVLRKIGGGAYGEVWLARGVTGALRAVKVLWREDFEDERSFEREFEGILKFEPISRDHPGMVNILHVGRSPDGKAFYYYVMELGDDVIAGREINPVEYEARTLRSDTKRTPGSRLDTGFCIDVGVRLAEALRHLHDNGLAHRDVKPANVIFVAGRAKLADIGLVAARGQRTFVGTEGFVPPEGPGSAQADVYSLGKVLYEIATGKDRMEFPELPDELPTGSERKRWLALNQIICDTCEPHLSKRRISTAGDLAEALRRLQEGKRRRRRRPIGAFVALALIAAVALYGGWDALNEMLVPKPPDKPEVVEVKIKVTSTPEVGASVIDDMTGEIIGDTPTELIVSYVGEKIRWRLEKLGYETTFIEKVIPPSAAGETVFLPVELKVYAPPQINEPWTDQLAQRYLPLNEGHEAVRPVGEIEWKPFAESKLDASAEFVEVTEGEVKRKIALTSRGDAEAFCRWLATEGIKLGYLSERHQIEPHMVEGLTAEGISERAKKEGLKPFRPYVSVIPFARVTVRTEPAGAEVFVRTAEGESPGGEAFGNLEIGNLKPGDVEIIAWMEGYKRSVQTLTLKPNENRELYFKLELNQSVVMDKPWTNGLEMKFVPVLPGELQACIWETRVKDFSAFLRAVHPDRYQVETPENHPVVHIRRQEAIEFCEWLTKLERQQERLTEAHRYRLPTDYEWSLMAGLKSELKDSSPDRREQQMVQIFPWGVTWPPIMNGANLGNFAGSEAAAVPGINANSVIAGYDDTFATTAPVGSFVPNSLGIYDISGNVLEWVEENYNSETSFGVLRGGSWKSYRQQDLYTGFRYTQLTDVPDEACGFRIVLAKDPPKPEIPSAERDLNEDG